MVLKVQKMAKTGFTLRIDEELLERTRNTIWALGNRTTITDILADALAAWCEEQERQHNEGQPFPVREGELPFSKKRKASGE